MDELFLDAKKIPITITKNKYVVVLVYYKRGEYQIEEFDIDLELREFLIKMLIDNYGDDDNGEYIHENIDRYSLVELIQLSIQLSNLDVIDDWAIASIVDVNKGLTYKVGQ